MEKLSRAEANEDIRERIAALLKLAENNANIHEAAAAAEKAAKLLVRYNLTLDEVNAGKPPEIVDVRVDNYKLHRWRNTPKNPAAYDRRRYPNDGAAEWYRHLSDIIARLTDCDASIFSPLGATFIGNKNSAEMAAFLLSNIYSRLHQMADDAVKIYAAAYKQKNGVSPWRVWGFDHPKLYRKGWLEGAAAEISSKIWTIVMERYIESHPKREHPQTETEKQALVVRDAIEVYKQEHFGWVREVDETKDSKLQKTFKGSGEGFYDGMKSAKSFELQHGIKDCRTSVAELSAPKEK
jgi:hypothetical protein